MRINKLSIIYSLKFIFSTKCINSLTLKRHDSFQYYNKKNHTVLLTDLWFLHFNKKLWNSVISAWVGAPQASLSKHFFFPEMFNKMLIPTQTWTFVYITEVKFFLSFLCLHLSKRRVLARNKIQKSKYLKNN